MLDGRLHRPPHLYATVRVAILAGILFLSGIGSLIFETLWLRLSGLSFGNSVWAAALILSSFMAGLALGNAIAASSRFRRWRPLHLYAVLELAVAFFGCTIVFGLPLLGELMRPVWQMLWNYQPTLIGLRFVLSFLILLIPTTAMGLTLPVLVEDPILRRANFGRAIGFLYGSNTLGAVAGAVVGEAYFIEAFGLRGTGLAAGLASCIAAAIALLVSKRDGDTAALIPERAVPLRLDVSYRPPWRLLFVSFGTGAIVLCLEVVWFRFLRLYVPSSSTAFAVMLAVPGWDRAGRHCGWRDSPPLGATEPIASSPLAAGRDSDAFLIFVLSRGSGSNARRSIRRLLAADWVPLHRLNVPSRVSVGDFVSIDRCMCSSQRRRPYEQHRDYHVV